MKTTGKRTALVIFVLVFLWIGTADHSLTAAEPPTRWYVVTLDGVRAGYGKAASFTRQSDGETFFVTETESRLVINRLGAKVDIRARLDTEEDREGRLLRFHAETVMSTQTVTTEGEVAPGEVTLSTRIGDAPASVRKVPFEGTLLGPEGIKAASLRLWDPGVPEVEYMSFSAEMGRVARIKRSAAGRETVTTAAGPTPCLRIKETNAEMPIVQDVWIDRQGIDVKTSFSLPFGLAESVLGDATAQNLDAAGGLSEESYKNTIARSNIRLPQARLIEAMTLKLLHRKPELGWPAFDVPSQEVLQKTPTTLVLQILRPDPGATGAASAPPTEEDLASNAYLDTRDPAVAEAVKAAVGSEPDPLRRALRLKDWVSERMTFDLGIAFAPSRELVRERRGTCVGYAELLATMARAAGIPSRVLFGFVYLDGMWGGHAWVIVHIGGRWLPLDSAVNGPGLADAARFAYAGSNLGSGPSELLTGGMQLFGNVEIRVQDYSLGGVRVRVPDDQPVYRTEGDRYANPGLGLTVRKPSGFVFSGLDKVWPDPVLLEMSSPSAGRVTVQQLRWRPGHAPESLSRVLADGIIAEGKPEMTTILGRTACIKAASGRAVAVVIDGVDAWAVSAEGGDAGTLLRRALGGLKLGARRAFPRED